VWNLVRRRRIGDFVGIVQFVRVDCKRGWDAANDRLV
jgi:hypothetical protein